jgi:hypothetical protein
MQQLIHELKTTSIKYDAKLFLCDFFSSLLYIKQSTSLQKSFKLTGIYYYYGLRLSERSQT